MKRESDDSLVIPLSTDIALVAADLSLLHKLAFADAVIYASAGKYNVELVTPDDHFEGLPGVTYFPKRTHKRAMGAARHKTGPTA